IGSRRAKARCDRRLHRDPRKLLPSSRMLKKSCFHCPETETVIRHERNRNMSANKPAHEIRLGLIKATIWHNLTRAGERYNVTLIRLYRNGDTWKESTHFGRDDLLLAGKVLD